MSGRRRTAARERGTPRSERRVYLESSALLAGLLEDDLEVIRAVDPARTVLSGLTLAEARRALQRALHAGRIDDTGRGQAEATIAQLERDCTVLAIDDLILARAGRRFPAEPIRTLDAIHLASAELIDDPQAPITLLTRDARIRENAILLGLQVA